MNVQELYNVIKDNNKDFFNIIEQELLNLNKESIYDFQFEKKIKNVIKKYNKTLKVEYEIDVNYIQKENKRIKDLDLRIKIIGKNIKIEITKNLFSKNTEYYFSIKNGLEEININENYLNLKYKYKTKNNDSVLNNLRISLSANKNKNFIVEHIGGENEDYFGGSHLNDIQRSIYEKIKVVQKNESINLINFLLNEQEEINLIKDNIELEKLLEDMSALEIFFLEAKNNGYFNLNIKNFILEENKTLIRKIGCLFS